jgi:transposase
LLFGESSGLPVFSTHYPGSVTDVVSLKSFIEQVEFFTKQKYKLVMDKGFYSWPNIRVLLKQYQNIKFILSVPFTTTIAKKIVKDGKNKFNDSLVFKHGKDILNSYSFNDSFDNNNDLIYTVYYNEGLFNEKKQSKISDILLLKEEAEQNPTKYMDNKDYTKFLQFVKDKNSDKITATLNIEKINNSIKNAGWLIAVSNDDSLNSKDIINIYRKKDVVEKAFCRLKNNLELKRLRVHNDSKVKSKVFIATIALIISSYINNVMIEKNLYNDYTMLSLLKEIEKIKKIKCNDAHSFTPITKRCRQILESFDIQITELS